MAGGCIAAIFFSFWFGTYILNPEHIDWLLESNHHDTLQHFVGWEFFRFEPWHFPLGVIKNYGYPIPTSIVYTDSIPVLALLFKCFSRILPVNFQYFGLWYALCFILQGTFSWALCKQITTNPVIKCCITLFFLLSPIMQYRMIEHQALVAHWVILAGFWLYLCPYDQRTDRAWLILNSLALLIHAYLAVMTFIIWLAFLYQHTIRMKHLTWRQCIQRVASHCIILALLAWLSGYFILPLSSIRDPNTYHLLSMDLIDPFVVPSDKLMTQSDEGFNYFGLGMLALLGIGLGCLIKRSPNKATLLASAPLIVVCILMAGFAISNSIHFNHQPLISYEPPAVFLVFFEVFRASGRFFWPLYYLLMLLTLTLLCKRVKTLYLIPLLCGALALQFIDVSHKFMDIHQHYKLPLVTHPSVDERLFNRITEPYRRIVFLPYMHSPSRQIKGFSEYIHYAATHHITINQGYFSRENASRHYNINKRYEADAYHGQFSTDTVYIILERNLAALLTARARKTADTLQMNGYTFIFPSIANLLKVVDKKP